MLLALASFISMCGIYLGAMPTLYNATAVEAGTMKPYPSLASDLVVMLKLFFVVQTVFFLSLWAVKLSLMFMYRKLTKGIPHFEKIWWAILGFMMITYGGFVVSEFTSCSSLHAWFTAGTSLHSLPTLCHTADLSL